MTTDRVTADGRVRLLADGNEIPMVGLGVWQVPNGPECVNAVRWALELGCRHIDTAQAYGNEESVGRALRDSGIAREEVFITTKFYPARNDPAAEAERSLRRLGVDHVDLYIIHWPHRGPTWA
jgi:diketogulonate reductase-like aldo/keto reductase